jgi:hypothetical protein
MLVFGAALKSLTYPDLVENPEFTESAEPCWQEMLALQQQFKLANP